jgi:anti-sigma B factor antagonist
LAANGRPAPLTARRAARAQADQLGAVDALNREPRLAMTMNAEMTFSILVDQAGTVRLAIRGRLDAVTAPDLREAMDSLLLERPPSVDVDLAELRMIDSRGVGVLISMYKRAAVYGGKLLVTGLRDQPLAIFRILRLDRFMCGRSHSAVAARPPADHRG